MRARRRRGWLAIGGVAGTVVLGGTAIAAGGGITIDPTSGPPGVTYHVDVECGPMPSVLAVNTQDAPIQGTIAPRPASEFTEVSPSTWRLTETAGETDERYAATCDGTSLGEARFDAESPHLWFGPRPPLSTIDPRTTLEGTDCPPGTTAQVTIYSDGRWTTATAPIDEFGDWSVPLPDPVGSAEILADATCGAVEYAAITATSVPAVQPTTPPTAQPTVITTPRPPTPPASPAEPQAGPAGFTG